MTKPLAKKISVSQMVNLVLASILIVIAVFGYFYYRGLNPAEVIKASVPTNTLDYQYQFAAYAGKKDFKDPYEVLAFNNSIYVSDSSNSRIVVMDRNGKFKQEIKFKELVNPSGMFWDGNQLWVADAGSGKVFVLNPEGVLANTFTLAKDVMPVDITVDQGVMYLLNNKKMQVEKYDVATKKMIKSFGGYGNSDGQLYYPYCLTLRDGNIYVADSLNNRINVYDLEGKFLKALAKIKDQPKPGGLAVPRGLTFDKEGRLYTVEGLGHRVSIIDQNGSIIHNINKTETIGDDVQDMNLPTDITFDEVGRMYVLEYAFRRVLVYKPL